MPSLEERFSAAQQKALEDRIARAKAARPEPAGLVERIFRATDDTMRSIASGMTFGLADEFAAGMNTLTGGDYASNLAAERARDVAISPFVRIPGEIVGGVTTGAGLGRAGLTLFRGARAGIGSLAARGAAEGAAYGAAHGFGRGEGVEGRVTGAATGAVLGAATGGVTGAVGGALLGRRASGAPGLKAQATQAYREAEQAGVVVRANSFSAAVDRIQQRIAEAGIDKTIHPKAMAAFARLEAGKESNHTLKGLDLLRRVIKSAASSNEADERRIAMIMADELDDYIGSLGPADVFWGDARVATAALRQARTLWSKARKTEMIEGLIERANNRAGQFTGSGYENALRTEFRQLAQNVRRMRLFTTDEQEAIRLVARGGPAANVLRALGRFAPRGVVSGGFHLGVAAGVDPTLGVATMAVGESARRGATALTARNAQRVLDTVVGGAQSGRSVTLTPKQVAVLRSLLIGEAQQTQQVVPLRPNRGKTAQTVR